MLVYVKDTSGNCAFFPMFLPYGGIVKRKRVFEHAHIQNILRMRKVSSGYWLSIYTLCIS